MVMSFDHVVVLDHAAMAVVGVFAEADVGDHHQFRRRPLGPPHHARHQAVAVPGVAARGILVVRDAEQHQRLHPVARQALHHVLQLALGDARDAGHLGDRQGIVDAFLDEDRLDQVVGGDGGLAHQAAQRLGLAQPAQTGGGERRGHGYLNWVAELMYASMSREARGKIRRGPPLLDRATRLRLCCAGSTERRRTRWRSTNSASISCGPAR